MAINKPFKQAMKKSDCEFRINNHNTKCPSEDDIIRHVIANCYNDNIIKKDTIIKSFKNTGISIKMNDEENWQITLPDKFVDNLPFPDNLDYTDLKDDDLDKDFELFNFSRNFASTQPTINSFLKE